MKVPVLVFLVSGSLLDLVGCAGTHSPREKYFLVVANVNIPYWQAAAAGLMQAARELQVNAELVGLSTYDPKAEQQEFQRAARLKPAGILISPADPGLMAPDIDAAIDAGIPVITMDSDSPASKRLLFIGTNNYEAGLMGGRITAKLLQAKGNVVVFTMPGQANLDERLNGYLFVFSGYPLIKIVDVVNLKGVRVGLRPVKPYEKGS
jgi:ribose transport system substrate-binding protein